MSDLDRIRMEIDETDRQITACLEKRMALTEQVADYKLATGKNVYDAVREAEKLKKVQEQTMLPENRTAVKEIFQQIMSVSRKRQYQLLAEKTEEPYTYRQKESLPVKNSRVVFQGVEGAYSFAAMKAFFGETIESSHVATWKEAMEQIRDGIVDFAVLPIENSTAGIVSDIYDLLSDFQNYIVGEQIIPIRHMILGVPGADISDIRTVYSHPQGLAQCSRYLDAHYPDWAREKMLNTAMAAKQVAEDKDRTKAAIASEAAAELFGLKVLDAGPLTGEVNFTRFVIVSGRPEYRSDAAKISICFELPHEAGSLYNIMGHFTYNGLNMTKIQSRPIRERTWEYRFFVDFEGNLSDPGVKNALFGIASETVSFRVLGNY